MQNAIQIVMTQSENTITCATPYTLSYQPLPVIFVILIVFHYSQSIAVSIYKLRLQNILQKRALASSSCSQQTFTPVADYATARAQIQQRIAIRYEKKSVKRLSYLQI